MRKIALFALAAPILSALAACKADLQVSAKTSSDKKPSDMEQAAALAPASSAAPEPQSAPVAPKPPEAAIVKPGAWIGVVHDLTLSDAKARTPVCQCMAAVAGQVSDPAFIWRTAAPTAGDDTVAVAIAGENVPCDFTVGKQKKAVVPSIAGTEVEGNDVIVYVESAHEGRPTVHGALVKRPPAGGSIIVKTEGRVPFARRADGAKGVCKIPLGG